MVSRNRNEKEEFKMSRLPNVYSAVGTFYRDLSFYQSVRNQLEHAISSNLVEKMSTSAEWGLKYGPHIIGGGWMACKQIRVDLALKLFKQRDCFKLSYVQAHRAELWNYNN